MGSAAGWRHTPEARAKIGARFKKPEDRPCPSCGLTPQETAFYYHSRGKQSNGEKRRSTLCKKCRTFASIGARQQRHVERIALLQAYKARRGCIDCGEHDPVLLVFHHIDPSQKVFTISEGRMHRIEKLEVEIEKCWVQCHKCHANRHYGRKEA